MVVTCMIVAPKAIEYANSVSEISDELITQASEYMLTEEFKSKFTVMC